MGLSVHRLGRDLSQVADYTCLTEVQIQESSPESDFELLETSTQADSFLMESVCSREQVSDF